MYTVLDESKPYFEKLDFLEKNKNSEKSTNTKTIDLDTLVR